MGKLKNIMFALAMSPCLLFLTACGGSNVTKLDAVANVNTGGTYIAATKSDFVNYAEKNTTTVSMSGYRMSGTVVTPKQTIGAVETPSITLKYNSIIVGSTPAELKAIIETETNNLKCTNYVSNGFYYTNANSKNVKVKILKMEDVLTFAKLSGLVDVDSILQIIKSMPNGVVVEQCEEGTIKKFKIDLTQSVGLTSNVMSIYFVFDSGKLVGYSFTSKNKLLEVSLNMSQYTGDIKLPELKGYEEIPSL